MKLEEMCSFGIIESVLYSHISWHLLVFSLMRISYFLDKLRFGNNVIDNGKMICQLLRNYGICNDPFFYIKHIYIWHFKTENNKET